MLPVTSFSHTTMGSAKPGHLVYRLFNGITKPQLLVQVPNGDLRLLDLKTFSTVLVDAREPVLSLGLPEWRADHTSLNTANGVAPGDLVMTATDTLINVPNALGTGMFASTAGVYQPVQVTSIDVRFIAWEVGVIVDRTFVAIATKP